MKRLKKYALLLVLLALALLPLSGVAAKAEAVENLWLSVTASEDGDSMPAGSVRWYKADNTYYFFLPGGTDWQEVRIWFDGSQETLAIGGVEYRSGDRMDGLQDGSEFSFTAEKKKYAVKVMQGSSQGALFMTTETGDMKAIHKDKEVKEAGSLYLLEPDGSVGYDGGMDYLKMRGNTAPTLNKKNYGFKLESGKNLLGLGKAKRWVLVGAYRDRSQLRTQIVFDMARYVGLPYTPDCTQVDVYFNNEYYGMYLLTEKIEINDNRVDVADLEKASEEVNEQPLSSYPMVGTAKGRKGQYKAYAFDNDPEDITGGYLIEYENYRQRYNEEPSAYTTKKGKVLAIKDPEYVSEAQMKYISEFMQGYENAIFAKNGVDPVSGKRYDEFVDFESLVLKYMLEEVSMNVDANASSQYYVKPSDSESTVAFAGPAWDYDMSFASFTARAYENQFLNPEGLLHIITSDGDYWWGRLWQKEEFKQGVRQAWSDHYAPAMSILLGEKEDPDGVLLSIAKYQENVAKSAAMNFTRWPIKSNYGQANAKRTGFTFEANVEYLTGIVTRRRNYLEKKWGGLPPTVTEAPAAAAATPEVTAEPTVEPTAEPTVAPTPAPTAVPEATPAPEATAVPQATPTQEPVVSVITILEEEATEATPTELPPPSAQGLTTLPMDDYTAFGPVPDPKVYVEGKHQFSTENTFNESTYIDESIQVYAWREWINECCYNVARIRIADPSQLRTALAENKIWRNHYIWVTAERNSAVVACGGEWLNKNESTYTVRMGVTLRTRGYTSRDALITDQNGDFHILKPYSHKARQALEAEGVEIINLFNFGPALVIDGEVQHQAGAKKRYPVGTVNGKQPRTGLGQIGPLEYLMVVTDGRSARSPMPDGSTYAARGCTADELADYMKAQGCVQAYNLDGGGSAAMYYNGGKFSYPTDRRGVTDIVYFATLVDAGIPYTAE